MKNENNEDLENHVYYACSLLRAAKSHLNANVRQMSGRFLGCQKRFLQFCSQNGERFALKCVYTDSKQ